VLVYSNGLQKKCKPFLIMKKIIFIAVFLPVASFSQKFATINYIVYPSSQFLESVENKKSIQFSNHFEEIITSLRDINFELIIENKNSYFYMIKGISEYKKSLIQARIMADDSEYFYNSESNATIQSKNYFGKKFNILLNDNNNWELENEEKNIGEFKCFKATKTRLINEKLTKIVAWYCPKIPLNFGPKNHNGLPGLIIMLEENRLIYLVNKIKINDDETNMKVFKGNLISEDDFFLEKEKINQSILIKN
jgi:GLPGLI family protein